MTRIFLTCGIRRRGQTRIFQIVLQIPSRRIAWRTMSNGFTSGVVSFEPRLEQENRSDTEDPFDL